MAAKSDGGSSSYYKHVVPAGILKISGGPFDGQPLNTDVIMETDDVIKIFLKNDWHKANIFKALVRIGSKNGIDESYDFNKMQWFLDRLRVFSEVEANSVPHNVEHDHSKPLQNVYEDMMNADPIFAEIMKDIKKA